MFDRMKTEIEKVESQFKNTDSDCKKIHLLNMLKEELNEIINDKCKGIIEEEEKSYTDSYDTYLKKYRDYIYKSDTSYELSQDYKEYDVSNIHADLMEEFMSKLSISSEGKLRPDKYKPTMEEYKMTFEEGGFENEIFYIRPYNWRAEIYGNCSCGLYEKVNHIYNITDDKKVKETICTKGFHEKWCGEWDVVFCYKPTGLKIKSDNLWYIFRGGISNHPLNTDIVVGIFRHCIESVL